MFEHEFMHQILKNKIITVKMKAAFKSQFIFMILDIWQNAYKPKLNMLKQQ